MAENKNSHNPRGRGRKPNPNLERRVKELQILRNDHIKQCAKY